MSVKRCMREVDAEEFHEWQVRDAIEPIGENRTDLQTASIIHALVCMLGKRRQNPKLSDFIPNYWKRVSAKTTEKERKEQSWQASETIATGFMLMRAITEEQRRRRGIPNP